MTDQRETEKRAKIESDLIKIAYAATLDPSKLVEFERFWTTYIDAKIDDQIGNDETDDTHVEAHIVTALDILDRIKSVNEKEQTAQILVDSHYGFGFIISHEGNILVSNDGADRFTRNSKKIEDTYVDALSKTKILKWMTRVRSGDAEPYNFLHVYLNGSGQSTCWFICPIKVDPSNRNNRPDYFLITSVDYKVSSIAQDIIGKSFGLTPAEADVAGLLTTGLSPKEIAEIREVKITAVRTQIASIKNKMGCRDLPAVVLKFASMVMRETAVNAQIGRMAALRGLNRPRTMKNNMTLRDGRNYEYYTQGHPDGKVILYIHSMVSGIEFRTSTARNLVLSGYKIISPARAGYGQSSPRPFTTVEERVNGCVSDLIELIDHLNIDDYVILTDWSGAIAQRLALKDRRRAAKLFLSGAVPVWKDSYIDWETPRFRSYVKTSVHAPRVVPYLMKLSKVLQESDKNNEYLEQTQNLSDIDREAIKQHSYLIKEHHKFLSTQGVQARTQDLSAIHTDWTADATRLKLPVTLIMGSDNREQPESAVIEYREAVPHSELKIIDCAGTYQNLSHFKEILGVIDS